MAIMIPDTPMEFDPKSREDLIFDALKLLPDDYYVFHSLKISTVKDGKVLDGETDFVIFNRFKGILCFEAKYGQVKYENRRWLYESGLEMKHGGPFNQAKNNMYELLDYVGKSKYADINNHCKYLHAVWFHGLKQIQLDHMQLPPEIDKKLILTMDSLMDPQKEIDRIFDLDVAGGWKTDIGEAESKAFVRNLLCPSFNVFPTASFDADLKKIVFHRLLNEQAKILNYLDEQKTAVINGAAGTGKTMIAVQKAQRHAADGQKVLFLCVNSMLKDDLAAKFANDNIDFYSIAGYACKLCNTTKPDYKKLKSKLEDMYLSESFPYQHVIVDEGQDFGKEAIEEMDILEQLKDIVTDKDNDVGSFYVFYDKLQKVQSEVIPKCIEDADCRLTLYRNCRNTENIAKTSLRPFSERTPKLMEGAVKGAVAKFRLCETEAEVIKSIDNAVDSLLADGINDIVILTCKTEETSILKQKISNGKYRNKYLFSTCRKFKGLEADAVILIDVDDSTFNSKNVQLYYVGTSRARIRLDIVAILNDDQCNRLLEDCLKIPRKSTIPKRDLCKALNCVGVLPKAE